MFLLFEYHAPFDSPHRWISASVWRLRENNEKVHNDPKRYKDPKFYNDPKQYDEFLRYIFVSYSAASTVTSDRPFHQFRWHCQHCLFPANSPAQFASHVIAPVAPKTLKYFADTVTIPTPHQDNYINTWTSLGSTHNTHRYRHTPSIITDPGHHHHHHLLSLLHLFHWHSQHYNASQLSWRPWWSLNFSWPHLEWPWRHPFSRLFSAFDLVYSFSQHSITDTSARIPPIRKQHHITHVTSQHIIPSFPTIYHFIRHFILMSIAITLTQTHHTTRYIYCSFNSSYFYFFCFFCFFLPHLQHTLATALCHPLYHKLDRYQHTLSSFHPGHALGMSQSPFYPPNLPPPDQMTVAELSNAILSQLFQYFQTSPP